MSLSPTVKPSEPPAAPKEAQRNRVTAAPGAPKEVGDALNEAFLTSSTQHELLDRSLQIIAAHFDAPYAAVNIEGPSSAIDLDVSVSESAKSPWKRLSEGMLLAARYKRLATARFYRSKDTTARFALLAVPLSAGAQGVIGSLAVVSPCGETAVGRAQLSELKALAAVIGIMFCAVKTKAGSTEATSTGDHAGIAKAASYNSLQEFAFAIANNLKGKLGCEQVNIGLVKGRGVRVLCMSGLDNLYPRTPGAIQVRQAMEECLDAQQTVCYQQDEKWAQHPTSTGHKLHQQWHVNTGNSAVASIPLMVDGDCIAVLSLRNPANSPYDPAQLDRVREMVTPLAPGLLLLERTERSLLGLLADRLKTLRKRWFAEGGVGRKVMTLLLPILSTWILFGSQIYFVSVPCTIQPAEVRHLAAPFEGTIAAAHVKPGDRVMADQLLITMDTADLRAEQAKLSAELRIAELELANSAAAKDLPATALARSRRAMAASKLQLVEARLTRAEIRAPAAGSVLGGDVTPRIGQVVPLGDPLLEFAPDGKWDVELQIPEFAAPYLRAGQAGTFVTSARPDQISGCQIYKMELATEVINGENVFVAQAHLEGQPPEWVRSGMEGVARIDAGSHAIWWVWLHRVIDSVRLQLWKL